MNNDDMLFSYKNIAQLNRTELYIRDYIAAHPYEVLQMNVRELADAVNVSTATLVRFTQKLGCQGMNDFKEKLQEAITGARIPDAAQALNDIQQEIERYGQPDYQEKIHQFAQKIIKATLTIVYGTGKSGSLSAYAARCFSDSGFSAIAITDPFYPEIAASSAHIFFICLSHSGETKEALMQLERYKKSGAAIGCITAHSQSSIAQQSDIVLDYRSTEIYRPDFINLSSETPMILLTELVNRELITDVLQDYSKTTGQ